MAEDILGREERNQLDFQISGWLCEEGSKNICTVGEAVMHQRSRKASVTLERKGLLKKYLATFLFCNC